MPLARLVGADRAEAIEGRIGMWPFLAEPPPEALAFFSAFAEVHSFTGSGSAEVERNLARYGGVGARVHAFRPAARMHLAEHHLRSIGSTRSLSDFEDGDRRLVRAFAPPRSGFMPQLVVQPGSGGVAKRWSRHGFVEIMRWWRDRPAGRAVVLLGPAEEHEREYWSIAADEVVGGIDLLDAAALLARAGAYIGNDSGISHLAGLVGGRGLALFGPTDPELWRPLSRCLLALRLEPWTGADSTPSAEVVATVCRALAAATSP